MRRNGSVPQTPASTGVSRTTGSTSRGHVDDDRVGVAVGQQPGERAAAGHAVAAGVVDDDQVDAAGLGALGREARARAGADDRLAAPRPWRAAGRAPRSRFIRRPSERSRASFVAPSRRAKAGSLTSSVHARSARRSAPVALAQRPRRAPRRPRRRGTACPVASRSSRRRRSGMNSAVGPVARESFCADPRPSSRALLGVVRISVTWRCARTGCGPRTARGTVSRGAEVDHVQRAERDDLRQARAGRPPRAGPAPREGRRRRARRQLGGRHVEHAAHDSRPRIERLHRAPAGAGHVERRAPRSRAPRAPRAAASRTAS